MNKLSFIELVLLLLSSLVLIMLGYLVAGTVLTLISVLILPKLLKRINNE